MDSVNYTIKIDKIFSGNYNNLTDVAIRVDWTLLGTFRGLTYAMPQTINLTPPNGGEFIPLANLTNETIASWIEQQFITLPDIKRVIENSLREQDAVRSLNLTERSEE